MRDFARLERVIVVTGIKIPSDLVHGSYRWRSYLYANLLKGEVMTMEEKAMMVDLFKSLMGFHKLPWSRKVLIPLDADRRFEMHRMLMVDYVYRTESAEVLRAVLWQLQAIRDGMFYTDDHVLSLVPTLAGYLRKIGEPHV